MRDTHRTAREKTGSGGMKKREKKNHNEKTAALYYGMGVSVLVFLIGAALLAPKAAFDIQDRVRCADVVLGELESMDIISFNTGYDTDLYSRLFQFADGLNKGQEYYVAAQELEITSELTDILYSEQGLYQYSFMIWLDESSFISEEMLYYNVTQWKQYVIYGDDFSDGVNFILWYIELADDLGKPVLKLLTDAETGDIYAIGTLREESSLNYGELLENVEVLTLADVSGITDIAWLTLAYYYGGLGSSELFRIIEEYGYVSLTETNTAFYDEQWGYEISVDREPEAMAEAGTNSYSFEESYTNDTDANIEILSALGKISWKVSEDGNCLDFLFPYSRDGGMDADAELCFRMKADGVLEVNTKEDIVYLWPGNFTMGFTEIYERIPEFVE